MESWVTRDTIFKGHIFNVEAGQAALPDGRLVHREIVTHDGGVAVVPVLGDTVLLIRQYRVAIGQSLLELPAGRREGQEDPAFRAAQELEEETGYRAGQLRLLITYFSSAGFTNERMHIYLATDLTDVPPRPEPDEQIEVVPVTLHSLPELLATGAFEDAKTIIGLRELLALPDAVLI